MVGSAVFFTLDVSAGGFCTESMRVLMPGTPVEGSIEGNGKRVSFAGRVAWNVPGDSALNVRGRMGIAFQKIIPEMSELLSTNRAAGRGAA
jgi:hypothetical protein